MFQSQHYFEGYCSTPSFVRERSVNRSLTLLQMTQHVRDRHQRLATPDKAAVMDLSSSFEKRRLGKQQQILSDIAARCREQEINDLSSEIAEKMVLQEGAQEPEVSTYMTNYMAKKERTIEDLSGRDDIKTPRKEVRKGKSNLHRGYKSFPARKIIKHPRNEFQKASLPKVRIAYIKGMPRAVPNSRTRLVETQPINGPIQLEHYIQPKLDPLAPLIRDTSSLDNEYQNRIDSYFSTARISLGARSKTMWETGSGLSGPSYMSHKSAKHIKPVKSMISEFDPASDTDSPGPPVSQLSKITQ
ncbi:uncharacterized protein LOC124277819 [Haliotis rubra]|uniref:uncharacterized protein LOC124277819 n=1 Tax=Haliotis rubra TaxID=36100 RepID=UPI001EE630DA|nr:uncharacterized protein LOC124277819 [Haliotis rubra]